MLLPSHCPLSHISSPRVTMELDKTGTGVEVVIRDTHVETVEILEGSILICVIGVVFLSDMDGDLTRRYFGDCGSIGRYELSRLCCLGCTELLISSTPYCRLDQRRELPMMSRENKA